MLPSKVKHILANADNRDLLVSSAAAFVIRVLGAISGFAATFFIARHLGAAESGYYFLAFSVITIISAFSRAGLDNTVLRYTGSAPDLAVNTTLKSVFLILLLGSFSAIVLYFCAPLFAETLFSKPELAPVLQYMAFGVVGLSVLTISAMALQGLRRVSASIFVLNIAINLLLILSLYLVGYSSAAQLAGVYAFASIAVGAIGFSLFYWFRPREGRSTISWRELFASCGPLWVVVIMSQMVQWSGQFMAGAYVSSEALAQLAVAQRTAMLSSFILIAVNLVVAPRFAKLYRNNDMAQLESLAIKSVKLIGLFALPVIGVMLVFPSFLMSLFGAEFTEGAALLQILAIGQFINAMTGSVGFLLMMSGHERDMRNVTLISGTLALLFTWFLTAQFGIVGAAIGTAIAVATQNLLAVYFVKKRLGFNTLAVWR
ncbi:membrane protein involved in the export of O-antigen and teichoic acid [Spongiibacter sp. IMCC21906]|uniref:flippase n=1 Tax=Spongiibacter sp. IMCC21906 TaxID=1620392 RepID=UPI00062E0969|nr:flippase [Spongiibacter sp. IMCC21906]AKH67841.1 membrane protein involved in the export of O-antigen and teichoic acid [Spongiibacter sp. IMCC21906]